MSQLTRRRFLEDSILAAAAAATAAAASPARSLFAEEAAAKGANDTITAAIIGCGIRGKVHGREAARFADCNIAYVCDPDTDRMGEVSKIVTDLGRAAPRQVQDLRRVLDDDSVDVVFISTCNHWHALAAIWAMQAGKDVYVEKPVSHNVAEGRRIVQVARKTNRICQGGTQNRSNVALAAAVEYMKQGKLGEVKLAKSVVYGRRGSIGGPGPCEIPASVDYNLWAGPASIAPPNRPRLHYDWHWVWDTGNGELGNNNIHSLDICRWGLGLSGLGRRVVSYGGRLGYADAGETPNTQVCVFDYGDKTIVSETRGLKTEPFHPNYKGGWIFFGTEGIISATSLFDPQGNLVSTFEGRAENHFANFLKAVRSRNRDDLTADILEGHQSTSLCHIGNISWRLGRPAPVAEIRDALGELKVHDDATATLDRTLAHLRDNGIDPDEAELTLGPVLELDGDREAFVNHPQADVLLAREYRRPFVVPSESEI
jgi:predicted dehydrogenase